MKKIIKIVFYVLGILFIVLGGVYVIFPDFLPIIVDDLGVGSLAIVLSIFCFAIGTAIDSDNSSNSNEKYTTYSSSDTGFSNASSNINTAETLWDEDGNCYYFDEYYSDAHSTYNKYIYDDSVIVNVVDEKGQKYTYYGAKEEDSSGFFAMDEDGNSKYFYT